MWRKLEGTAEMIPCGPLRFAEIGDTLVKGIGLPAPTLLSDIAATLREADHIEMKNAAAAAARGASFHSNE